MQRNCDCDWRKGNSKNRDVNNLNSANYSLVKNNFEIMPKRRK